MRPIPAAFKAKLLNRFKAESTDSMPHVRLIATQTSINTLLSEPIHEDIAPAFGDVAVRQYIGEKDLSCAYAICLDDGIATIYRRQFPANLDYKWEYQWTFGEADDVAIEYDGTWTLDASANWYYLLTEEFPYIFTVEDGILYVQYWRDTSTKTQLAEGVSQISACKGWRNSIDNELDQGLIIGYLRDGEVFYRALCTQENGSRVWEAEHQVHELGQNNDTLSVIRTNDFRIGFLTEHDGEIVMALTYRNYAGMSVRPETLHANAAARFDYLKTVWKYGYSQREYLNTGIGLQYFNFDGVPESEEISLVSAEKLNYETDFYSYGCKLYLSKPVSGEITTSFVNGTTVTVVNGSETSTVKVTDVEYDADDNAFIFYFESDIKRTCQVSIKTISSRWLWYYRLVNGKWFIPVFSYVFEPETRRIDGYGDRETLSVQASSDFWVDEANFIYTANDETMSVRAVPTVVLTPVSSQPI